MRSIITIAVLLTSFSTFANFAPAQLTVALTDHPRTSIHVMVDGQRFIDKDPVISIPGLQAGYRNLKVYREVMVVRGRRRSPEYQLLYAGSVLLKPRQHLQVIINRYGQASFRETFVRNQASRYNNNRNDDRYRGNNGYGQRRNPGSDYNNNYNSRLNNLNGVAFERMLNELRREPFESNRRELAMQVIAQHSLYTEQLVYILKAFQFEENKLELAKFAYEYIADPSNYYLLNSSFSFSGSKRELAAYIRSR